MTKHNPETGLVQSDIDSDPDPELCQEDTVDDKYDEDKIAQHYADDDEILALIDKLECPFEFEPYEIRRTKKPLASSKIDKMMRIVCEDFADEWKSATLMNFDLKDTKASWRNNEFKDDDENFDCLSSSTDDEDGSCKDSSICEEDAKKLEQLLLLEDSPVKATSSVQNVDDLQFLEETCSQFSMPNLSCGDENSSIKSTSKTNKTTGDTIVRPERSMKNVKKQLFGSNGNTTVSEKKCHSSPSTKSVSNPSPVKIERRATQDSEIHEGLLFSIAWISNRRMYLVYNLFYDIFLLDLMLSDDEDMDVDEPRNVKLSETVFEMKVKEKEPRPSTSKAAMAQDLGGRISSDNDDSWLNLSDDSDSDQDSWLNVSDDSEESLEDDD